MKKLFLKIFFWFLRKEYYKPLNKIEVDNLLTKLANTQGLEKLPLYLEQCATTAKNQYLYDNDPMLKGTIFALVSLKEQIMAKKQPVKKPDLTQEEKVAIIRGRGY